MKITSIILVITLLATGVATFEVPATVIKINNDEIVVAIGNYDFVFYGDGYVVGDELILVIESTNINDLNTWQIVDVKEV